MAVQVGAGGGGQHHAGAVVVREGEGALMGAGGEDDPAGADAVDAFGVFVRRFRVEGYAFEVLSTLVAGEAFGMEAGA